MCNIDIIDGKNSENSSFRNKIMESKYTQIKVICLHESLV